LVLVDIMPLLPNPATSGRVVQFGTFELNLDSGELFSNGLAVPLQKQPFLVLAALLARPGEVVARQELFARLWPNGFLIDQEHGLNRTIRKLRVALGDTSEGKQYIETLEGRGYRFSGSVTGVVSTAAGRQSGTTRETYASALMDELNPPSPEFDPGGGALPPNYARYVARTGDEAVRRALECLASIVLIHGPRQVGKSSLLARALQHARKLAGKHVVFVDLQKLDSAQLESIDSFVRALAACIAEDLQLNFERDVWDTRLGAAMNLDRFLRSEVLPKATGQIVLAIDEVDRLLACRFAGSIFGLFRSWHNARALDPQMPLRNLTVLMVYSAEEQLFISDVNQSPFNVGVRVELMDFSREEVSVLDSQFGGPLEEHGDFSHFYDLLQGQPYLSHRGLYLLSSRQWQSQEFFARAAADDGPFSDALHVLRLSIERDRTMSGVVKRMLSGEMPPIEQFYPLRSWGLLTGSNVRDCRFRCPLYRKYLEQYLI
jgi:DNA-binding winged helix-turn-helix (wHTH) protein